MMVHTQRLGSMPRDVRRTAFIPCGIVLLLLSACGSGSGSDPVSDPDDADSGAGGNGSTGPDSGGSQGSGQRPAVGGRRLGPGPGALPDGAVPDGCDIELNATTAPSFFDAVRCLFEGPDAVQRDATVDFDPERIAVLRGRVFTRAGRPLAGVRVSVLREDSYGFTETRAGGYYDLAVNGGGEVTLQFEDSRHLPAQRRKRTPWRRFVTYPDVALVRPSAPSATVTFNALSAPMVATGPEAVDAEGARTQSLLISPGTRAQMVLSDGTEAPLNEADIQITELTVGDWGPAAMPGELPPASGYTYAVDFSIVQARQAGATRVDFDPPLISYVDNFLGFPAGTVVPVGYYDPERARWEASESGIVFDIVGIQGGVAQIDVTGDGEAESAATLGELGFTEEELRVLATDRGNGASLWRATIPHFSAWDYNWPCGPPGDALFPDLLGALFGPEDCRTTVRGSIIGCEDQSLGERFSVAGTPFRLAYQSERAPGRLDRNAATLQVSGDTIPESLKRIDIEVEVLGHRTRDSLEPLANQTYEVLWDGRDSYGRDWQGRHEIVARVGYVYDGVYERAG